MMCVAFSAGACATLGATRYYPAYRSALAARDDLHSAQALLRERHLDTDERDLAQAEARLQVCAPHAHGPGGEGQDYQHLHGSRSVVQATTPFGS